jgi:non-ribosomal peptide synthetase component F
MRTDLRGNPSFREVIRRVREVVIGAHTHQELPFERLVEELQPERSLSVTPLIQVWFVLNTQHIGRLDMPGLVLSRMPVENRTAKLDLGLSLVESSEGLSGVMEYNTDLFDDETIVEILNHYEALLREVVASPDRNILDIKLEKETERRAVTAKNPLQEYNQVEFVF